MADPIRIDGLREFTRSLKSLDSALPKMVRLAANEAAKLIVDAAKPKVPLGPAKGGHAKNSIKAASTGNAARIKAGGNKYPYYPWLDFGGKTGRNKSIKRPFLSDGRYIWLALSQNRKQVEKVLEDGLLTIARSAGLEVD